MLKSLFTIALVSTMSVGTALSADPPEPVITEYRRVQGAIERDLTVYRGTPFPSATSSTALLWKPGLRKSVRTSRCASSTRPITWLINNCAVWNRISSNMAACANA
jgi:hypothetical protein